MWGHVHPVFQTLTKKANNKSYYNTRKLQTCNHSWAIKAPSSRQDSTPVSLNRLFNATITRNQVEFTCRKSKKNNLLN